MKPQSIIVIFLFFTDLFLPFIKERVVALLTDWTIQEWSLTQVHVQKELKSLVGRRGVGLGGGWFPNGGMT